MTLCTQESFPFCLDQQASQVNSSNSNSGVSVLWRRRDGGTEWALEIRYTQEAHRDSWTKCQPSEKKNLVLISREAKLFFIGSLEGTAMLR